MPDPSSFSLFYHLSTSCCPSSFSLFCHLSTCCCPFFFSLFWHLSTCCCPVFFSVFWHFYYHSSFHVFICFFISFSLRIFPVKLLHSSNHFPFFQTNRLYPSRHAFVLKLSLVKRF